MSSACVCHLNEWCFYCEMYSPLESKFELQEAENAALKQENEKLKQERDEFLRMFRERHAELHACRKERLDYQEWVVGSLRQQNREIEQLKADKAALLECVKHYAKFDGGGVVARECLAQIGGTQ